MHAICRMDSMEPQLHDIAPLIIGTLSCLKTDQCSRRSSPSLFSLVSAVPAISLCWLPPLDSRWVAEALLPEPHAPGSASSLESPDHAFDLWACPRAPAAVKSTLFPTPSYQLPQSTWLLRFRSVGVTWWYGRRHWDWKTS